MTSRSRGRATAATGPARAARPVSPSDAADLPDGPARSLFVGTGGVLRIVDESGFTLDVRSADAQYHPIGVARVLATGTTAAEIVALY